jgi:hypothetical protein
MKYLIFCLLSLSNEVFAINMIEERGRVASIYISETFINEQLSSHFENSELIKEIKANFDPHDDTIYLRGRMQLPMDDFRAMGIDPRLVQFKFQVAIKPRLSEGDYLVLEFPLSETYFYQASSNNPKRDRVVIPVQLLSLGIASMRGYLAALSGDFSSFDRKRAKLNALLRATNSSITTETNEDAKKILVREKKSLELQLASTALEREKFEQTSQTLSRVLGFTSEKEFNLNNEIKARDNAIMLRMKLKNIVPYLSKVELGDIKLGRNSKDGLGESYFILHLYSMLKKVPPVSMKVPYTPKDKFKVAPALGIRLNQAMLETSMVSDAEKAKMPEMVKDFNVTFKDDGIHVTGKVKKFFFNIPFDALVDFEATEPDVFEVRLRGLQVFMLDLKFLTPFALKAVEQRLKKALKGICTFKYVGSKDKTKVLRVKIDSQKLIPAFPGLHLVDVKVRDGNFMLRVGKTE